MVRVRPMPPKLVALIVAAALTTGWLLASVLSPPVAELQGLPDRTPPRAPAREANVEAPYTEQLHLKLQHAPVRPVPRRNPFIFGASAPERPEPSRLAAAPPVEPSPFDNLSMPPVVTGPALRLSGIGSTDTPDGLVHTAVLADGTTVHLVKVGENVAGYSVVEITEDTVTLANAAGAQWQLKMK